MKLGVLTGFNAQERYYIKACEELKVDFEAVDIGTPDWLSNIKAAAERVDGFLVSPPASFQEKKTIYDERLYFIDKYLKKPLFPNFNSCYIYENKRNMAAFLEYFGFPHAATRVFTDKCQAIEYLKSCKYPVVMKSNTGAGGSAVDIVKSYGKAKSMVQAAFGWHNELMCTGKKTYSRKYFIPIPLSGCAQRHYLLVQDFHPIKWEWRIIKIGNSYFGHQKLLKGEKASGSGLVGWVAPSEELLYLVKDICDKGGFDVMDVDILETVDGKLLVNELQTQFGSYLDYQMMVDGKPGRYVYTADKGFVFEEGIFNQVHSKLLTVKCFIDKLENQVK